MQRRLLYLPPCYVSGNAVSSVSSYSLLAVTRGGGGGGRIASTAMRRLTTGIRSENCVVGRFRRCANVIECTYTNLDNIAYYTPRLYDIAYCYKATNLYSMLLC